MIDDDVQCAEGVVIYNPQLVNIFGCTIGKGSFIGPFVEITRNSVIGENCTIESHSFICDSVTLEDDVFIGHGVMFTNDLYPSVGVKVEFLKTRVEKGASLGSNATIVAGVTIGEYSVIGAGAVVTKDVPPYSIVAGNPARLTSSFESRQELLDYMRKRQPLASDA